MRRLFFFLIFSAQCLLAFAQPLRHNTYAIVIGISQYAPGNNIPSLQYAHRDAQEFANYLQSKSGGSVPAENIHLLLNQDATVAAVLQAITWLKETCGKDDLVFFYFAGHGDKESQTMYNLGFLLTYNTPRPNYEGNALRIEYLNDIANTLSATNKANVVIITDACHSGDLATGSFHWSGLVGDALRAVKDKEIRIASCTTNQLSAEGKDWGGGRGAFSYYLVNGLKGLADRDHDGKVSKEDIQQYLDSCFSQDRILAENRLKQNPVLTGKSEFKLADVDSAALAELRQVRSKSARTMMASPPLPMQPQEYFFDLLKQSREYQFNTYFDQRRTKSVIKYEFSKINLEKIIDFNKLSESSVDEIPVAFVQMAVDSVRIIQQRNQDSTFTINEENIGLLISTLRESKDARNHFNDKLVVALHNRGQEIINLYLKADEAEMERHRYYNSLNNGYDVYAKMFALALKLTSPDNELYRLLQVNQHYFAGVAARLKIPSLKDPKKTFDTAMAEQTLANKLDPDAAYIHNELGYLYLQKKDFKNAELHFFKASQLAGDWAMPLVGLAQLYRMAKAYKQAMVAVDSAIILQPSLQENYVNKAMVVRQSGDLLGAEELYRKAMTMNSRHYLPFKGLAEIFLNTAQYQLADSFFFESALRLSNGNYYSYDEMNEVRHYKLPKSNPDSALVFCDIDSADVDKEKIMGHFAAGMIAFKANKFQLAERHLREVITTDPKNPLAFHYLGVLLFRQKRWQEAELIFKMAADLYLESEAFNIYIDSLIRIQPYSKSSACFLHLFTGHYYDRIEDNYFLGSLYASWNHYDEAEKQYRIIINTDKWQIGGYYKLWNMMETMGRYHTAEEIIREYITYNRPNGERELNAFYNRMISNFRGQPEWYYKAGSLLYSMVARDTAAFGLDLKYLDHDQGEEKFFFSVTRNTNHSEFYDEYYTDTYDHHPRLKLVKISTYLLPGTKEMRTIPDQVLHPMTDGIDQFKTADSILRSQSDIYDMEIAEVNNKIGDLYIWQGLPEKAIPYYQQSIETDPLNANIRSKLIQLYANTFQYGKALEQLDSLDHRGEINFPEKLMAAWYYSRSGNFEKADTLLKAAEKIHPFKVKETALLRSKLYLLSGRPKQAIPAFMEQFLQNQGDSAIMYTISRLYAQTANRTEALQWLQKAIDNGFNFSKVVDADPVWDPYRRSVKWQLLNTAIHNKARQYDSQDTSGTQAIAPGE